MRRLALVLAVWILGVPAAARADGSFPAPAVQELSARGNHIVYFDGGSLRLRSASFGTAATDIPGIGFGPFRGFDLGTDRRGREILVFSRCGEDTCRLFTYRFGEGRARRVRGISRRGCSEGVPRIERGVITWARESDDGGSCRSDLVRKRPGHRPRRLRVSGATADYDYSHGSLAYLSAKDLSNGDARDEIRLRRAGHRRSELVARATYDPGATAPSGPDVYHPLLDGGFVYWVRVVYGGGVKAQIQRRAVRGGPITTIDPNRRLWGDGPFGFAVTGGRLFYAYDQGVGRVNPPLPFR